MENLSKLALLNKIEPNEFDLTVGTVLIGLGAEKYVDIFRKKNIGQSTLIELTDEDLERLGVDDADIRKGLMEEVKSLPIYEEISSEQISSQPGLDPLELGDVFADTAQHLHRIYLSMLANSLALRKSKKISDCLLYRDLYASDIALKTVSEISIILNSMEILLHSKVKIISLKMQKTNKKKIIILGTSAALVLGVLFVRSLHSLKN